MIKYLSLFSGIGAFEKALERNGIKHELVGFSEIDKYAIKSYCAVHNVDPSLNLGDISKIDITTLPNDIDFITHGSPCQDFSVAGKQAGGDKGSGTRSSLMYETLRIVEKVRPKYVVWENVKNILSKKHKHNFYAYLERMEQLGYTNYYKILNTKNYGVPQNRERVFTISIRNDVAEVFTFPQEQELKLKLTDLLEDDVEKKYYLSEKTIEKLIRHKNKIINNDTPEISGTIHAGYYKMGGRDQQYVKDKTGIRRLTPKETWRLMGFDDADFEKAKKVNSDTQLYKQAGNSIVVNVLEAIFKKMRW